MKETKKTKVTLLSWTQNPLETIYAEWIQSRTQDPVPDPAWLSQLINDSDHPEMASEQQRVLDVFEKVVAMKMPLGEHIQFVFLLENCPIALREQLVRHRIGHRFGDKIGADIIPDLAGSSSFWSQTTRIIDMGKFATEGDYLAPAWLEENGNKPMPKFVVGEGQWGTVAEFYHEQMLWIQGAYRRLVAAGMPLEDARNVLPVAMQHRLTWSCNLSNIMHVLSRRGCWLAQLGMWEPVITGIVEELATKIHPSFRRLIDPPCFNAAGKFDTCAFKKENEEIVDKGEYPPCSLWVNNDYRQINSVRLESDVAGGYRSDAVDEPDKRLVRYEKMQSKYAQLWKRNPRTGERLQVS